jgi:DNA-binding transcriptional MerR regulator
MKIGELAERSGFSAHTIRYYERIGLVPRVGRDQSKHRAYDASILTWLEFIGRLKTTGMPIREMRRYAELRSKGPSSNAERRKLLEAHRKRVRAHVADLQSCLAVLDKKIAGYAGSTSRIENSNEPKIDHGSIRARKAGPR